MENVVRRISSYLRSPLDVVNCTETRDFQGFMEESGGRSQSAIYQATYRRGNPHQLSAGDTLPKISEGDSLENLTQSNNSINICFYSSFVFLFNAFIAYQYNVIIYAVLFMCLFITSLIFHSTRNQIAKKSTKFSFY
jgi:hypothetical protein